ncbi:MAG: type I restriction enzyme HsdR N-terminal domain-containing protein [Bacteroidales bacterium]
MPFNPSIQIMPNGQRKIFDSVRKKYVVLTHEELVRQEFIHFLTTQKSYPSTLLLIEHAVKILDSTHRCDIIVCDKAGKYLMIVECKAPNVPLSDKTFTQLARYNLSLRVPFLVTTNGKQIFCCAVNFSDKKLTFQPTIPNYEELF